MSDSSLHEINKKKTADDRVEINFVLPDGGNIYVSFPRTTRLKICFKREYSVTQTLEEALDDVWDAGSEEEIWKSFVIEVEELYSSDEEADENEFEFFSSSSESESEPEPEEESIQSMDSELRDEVHPVLNSMFNPYHNTLVTLTGRPYIPKSPEPPKEEKQKLYRCVKKSDVRLRAVTKSNFKIKEFKGDEMQIQIQSLDLFEFLVRVSFAESNSENHDREAQEATINKIIGNKQMADYNKYVVSYEDPEDDKKLLCERLNDPHYSLHMMRRHLIDFCEKEKTQVSK